MGEPNSATKNVWTGTTSTDWTVGSNWSTGDGIKIVDVSGASAANLFVLDAPISAGGSTYGLFQGGVANPHDGHWYLRTVAAGGV